MSAFMPCASSIALRSSRWRFSIRARAIASSSLSAAGQFALLDESLFPVDDVDALARRIDWWIDHPAQLAKWGGPYAEHTKTNYSVESSVRKFVAMEREAIADNRR